MRVYIYSRHIKVATDQKPLLDVFPKVTQSIRLENCLKIMILPLYTNRGAGNNADDLSRLPTTVPPTEVNFVEQNENFVKKDNALLSI